MKKFEIIFYCSRCIWYALACSEDEVSRMVLATQGFCPRCSGGHLDVADLLGVLHIEKEF